MAEGPYKGWTILVTVMSEDLFQRRDRRLINVAESRGGCSEYLTYALEQEYPGATVSVRCKEEGNRSLAIDVKIGMPTGGDEVLEHVTTEYVAAAVRMHFLSDKWIVEKQDG